MIPPQRELNYLMGKKEVSQQVSYQALPQMTVLQKVEEENGIASEVDGKAESNCTKITYAAGSTENMKGRKKVQMY